MSVIIKNNVNGVGSNSESFTQKFKAGRKVGVKLTSKNLQEKIDQLEKALQSFRLEGTKDEKAEDAEDFANQIKMISEIKNKVEEREISNQEIDKQKENITKQQKEQAEQSELEFSFKEYKKSQFMAVCNFLQELGVKFETLSERELKIKQPPENQHMKEVLERKNQADEKNHYR